MLETGFSSGANIPYLLKIILTVSDYFLPMSSKCHELPTFSMRQESTREIGIITAVNVFSDSQFISASGYIFIFMGASTESQIRCGLLPITQAERDRLIT